jgi:hypothetical protein
MLGNVSELGHKNVVVFLLVDLSVLRHVVLPDEPLAANGAREGLFTGV